MSRLDKIATCTGPELQGWWDALGKYQPELDGERAALLRYARKIGWQIKGVNRG